MNDCGLSLRIDMPDGSRFGPGKAALLKALDQTGSIRSAANSLEMSYPRALKLIEQMNTTFARPVVETRQGGPEGGGTRITETGKSILVLYQRICDDAVAANHKAMSEFQTYLSK